MFEGGNPYCLDSDSSYSCENFVLAYISKRKRKFNEESVLYYYLYVSRNNSIVLADDVFQTRKLFELTKGLTSQAFHFS